MLFYYLKTFYRNLLKHKQSYILNIFCLIIALTVGFITLFYVLFENYFYKIDYRSNNVYIINEKDLKWDLFSSNSITLALSNFLSSEVPGVKDVVNYCETGDFNIEVDPGKIYKEWNFHFVDSSFIKYKNITIVKGSSRLSHPNDLLLTREMALKFYGTLDCIGKDIKVYGHREKVFYFKVSGIFDYPFKFKNWDRYNLIANLEVYKNLHHEFDPNDSDAETDAFIVLDGKEYVQSVQKNIIDYYIKHKEDDYSENYELSLLTPKEKDFPVKRVRLALLISAFILLIAIINFVIHQNASFIENSKSIGIKKITGALSKQILVNSFIESLGISLISSLIAFLLAILLLPYFNDILQEAMQVKYLPMGIAVLIALGLTIVIAILTSISSFIMITRYLPIQLVNRNLSKGKQGRLVNSTLIVVQVSIFTFLMTMMFVTSKQLNYIQNKDWGFDTEQLLSISLQGTNNPQRYYDFKNRLDNIPTVVSSSGCRHVPPSYSIWFFGYFDEDGNKVMIEYNDVDYPYIQTLGLKLKQGRDFDENIDHPSDKKLIVNQQFLDLKGITNPLDTLVKIDDREGLQPIIGVLEDYHMRGMDSKMSPMVMRIRLENMRNMLVKISPNNVMGTLQKIENEFSAVYPDIAYEMKFVEDEIQDLYIRQSQFNMLISYYTIISIVIACLGLFGFVMNVVNKRIKEVGVRKVNGARVTELLSLLNKEFIILVAISFLIATPLAYHYSKQWLDTFAYKTEIESWVFLFVALSVFCIAFITISFQTWRIANRNPVEALRYE